MATVTVTDLEGLTASSSAQITVLPRPIIRPPAITKLTISPSDLLAARSGPTLAVVRKPGAIVAYRDSQTATTTFTIQHLLPGVRRNGRCTALKGKRGRRARCSLVLRLGSFTHADLAGANRFRFTGRIHGRRLAAGGYRLKLVPRDAAGAGAAVLAQFRVHH